MEDGRACLSSCYGVRPSSGAATPVMASSLKLRTFFASACIAVAGDGHTPPDRFAAFKVIIKHRSLEANLSHTIAEVIRAVDDGDLHAHEQEW